jgi:genome maintenance exonuclease 1
MFEHMTEFELPELSSETTENGRFYITPEGKKYPSVTTILGAGSDQSWKDEWIARVGKEEAERISKKATARGTAVHELVEQYLRNNPQYKKGHMPSNVANFQYIRPFLDKHIGKIAGLEVPLYSDRLRVAGRVDCIAEWDGVWSIVDFKTSKKEKSREDIHSYFMQESAYSMMMFERTGLVCKQLVTVMTVDDGESLVFVEKSRDWLPKFIELREKVAL